MILSASPKGQIQRGVPQSRTSGARISPFIGIRALNQRTYMNDNTVLMRYVQLTDESIS